MRRLHTLTLAVSLAASLLVASSAFAVSGVTTVPAPTTAATSSAATTGSVDTSVRLASGTVAVQYWMAANPGEAISIVSVELAPSVALPARVRIPIVDGTTVQWAGEISGQDVSQDIQRPFTVTKAAGGSYAEIVLSEFRVGQVDLSPVPLKTTDNKTFSAAFTFVQSVEASATEFSVRVPPRASDVKIEPEPDGAPEENEIGEALYTLPAQIMKPGDKAATSVEYTIADLPVPESPEDVTFRNVMWVLGITLVVLVGVLVMLMRRKPGSGQ